LEATQRALGQEVAPAQFPPASSKPHIDASEFLKSIGGKGEIGEELTVNWGGEIIGPDQPA